jgi:hypothetical protein
LIGIGVLPGALLWLIFVRNGGRSDKVHKPRQLVDVIAFESKKKVIDMEKI